MKNKVADPDGTVGQSATRRMILQKILLACGILASLIYVGADIIASMSWEGYSYVAQARSELSAIGAPTRSFMVPLLNIHSLLVLAFGVGVWISASQKRSLQILSGLLFTLGIIDLVSYFFPMHLRGTEETFTDTMHIILTAVTVLLILLAIGFSAAANGRWWGFYSIGTILLLLVCGAWAFMDAPRVAANLPTPWLGIRERINIYGYLLWQALLAIVLWREIPQGSRGVKKENPS